MNTIEKEREKSIFTELCEESIEQEVKMQLANDRTFNLMEKSLPFFSRC